MRKIIIPLCILMLSLCGCNSDSTVKPETANISFYVKTVFNNTEYSFTALTDKNSNLSLTVTEPDNITNFKMTFKSDCVYLNYLDLEKEIPLENFKEDSIFRILFEGISAASKTDKLNCESEEYYLKYSLNQNTYKMIFGESGLPIEIRNSDKPIITFSSITISN